MVQLGRDGPALARQASRLSQGHSRKITSMYALSNIDMGEVTRLTQAGKLAEAMALLQVP